MKKRTLYVLTALVLVVSGVVPVFCSDIWGGYLSLAATLLGALCTLLTLVIAIVLYDRFSLEREMASRQFEEVQKLKRGKGYEAMYDDEGHELERVMMEAGGECSGVMVPRAVWHTFVALEDGTTIFEAKDGAYDPVQTEEFLRV